MAKASRSAGSAGYSDDPIENFTTWLQMNARPIMYVVSAAVVIGGGTMLYRYNASNKSAKASAALYQAQGPMLDGKLDEARTSLERVATRYRGTSSGDQAALLLAQVNYEQARFKEGIKVLEDGIGSASKDSKASFEALIAAGHEGLKDHLKAAQHYGKAAELARFAQDKGVYRSSQGRELMIAGKNDEAKAIWLDLKADENSQFNQEARVRLGEILATAK